MGETPERPDSDEPDHDDVPPLGSMSDDPGADAEFAQMLKDAVRRTTPNREKLRRRAANGGVDVPEGAAFDDALAKLLTENSD